MKKKTLLLFLSLVLSCTALVGCGDSSKEEAVAPVVNNVAEEEPAKEAEEPAEETVEPEEEVAPEGMYRSELTNEWISLDLQNQRPIAVMVDNEKTALDHYGLNSADIVYEMMNSTMNGQITRFMAIVKGWGKDSLPQFGSIRSVRPTNFMIAPEYNAVVVHDGGPFYIDAYLKNPWVDHLSGGFSRVNNGKAREFTEYILPGDLEPRFKNSKISTEYNEYYQGPHFTFANESKPVDLSAASDSIPASKIVLPFDHNGSNLTYDEASQTYLYSEYGMKHIDPTDGNKQLSFKNLIIYGASHHQYDDHGYMQFNVVGESGKGYYITNGHAIPITWKKGPDIDPTHFYNANGEEITLNTGKTYIALVSTSRWSELSIK